MIAFNMLKTAFAIIPHSSFKYRKYTGKTLNSFGIVEQTFSAWTSVSAIIQPGIVSSFGGKCIELKDYKDLGLDWARRYVTVWIYGKQLEPAVNREGADQILHDGRIFTVLQVENWREYAGYERVYCVEDKTPEEEESSSSAS